MEILLSLIFVDCEAFGGCPATGQLTEFGAVEFKTHEAFHGVICGSRPSEQNPAVPIPVERPTLEHESSVYIAFDAWLKEVSRDHPVFVSDNPAYDWQWINDGFWRHLGRNPFGHSARRISDFYAGLMGDFRKTQQWKKLRITSHDHHPVHDALGNVEAFKRILNGER